jgi:hypothetical protein
VSAREEEERVSRHEPHPKPFRVRICCSADTTPWPGMTLEETDREQIPAPFHPGMAATEHEFGLLPQALGSLAQSSRPGAEPGTLSLEPGVHSRQKFVVG